ncbi:hypothetical protein VNO77_04270 [Canavalia gladiata]|uniref:Uncharacterized protein n=1 Tax=Canavalia gladiata TaxID=3824 RepID=A0AAN9L4T3_CANGL
MLGSRLGGSQPLDHVGIFRLVGFLPSTSFPRCWWVIEQNLPDVAFALIQDQLFASVFTHSIEPIRTPMCSFPPHVFVCLSKYDPGTYRSRLRANSKLPLRGCIWPSRWVHKLYILCFPCTQSKHDL